MVRTVVLPHWTDEEDSAEPAATQASHPQWTARIFALAPPKYPNTIRRYRLRHVWAQRDLAAQVGCRPKTISTWECGRSMPAGPRLLRLARVLDTLVENLYFELYTVQKYVTMPPQLGKATPTPRPSHPTGARIDSRTPTTLEAWWRDFLAVRRLESIIRAKRRDGRDGAVPLWLPVRLNGRTHPQFVSLEIWDRAPAHSKAEVMTVQWTRRYSDEKVREASPQMIRLAYENYLRLFQPHYQTLLRMVGGHLP